MVICDDEADVLTVTSNGFGKRSALEEYTLHGRGTKGMRAGVFTEKTGALVNLKLVKDTDDVMIIADNGIIIRIEASTISKIGRSTQGVKLMRLKGDENSVVCVAVTPHVDENEAVGEVLDTVDTQVVEEQASQIEG